MNIFKEMLLSIYDFKSYGGFLRNRKGKVFCFGLLLMLLYFILTWILPFARFHSITGGFVRLVREYVPDFKLENGRLWLEESFEYDYMGTYIYIDTNEDYQLGEGEELMSGENAAYSNILFWSIICGFDWYGCGSVDELQSYLRRVVSAGYLCQNSSLTD